MEVSKFNLGPRGTAELLRVQAEAISASVSVWEGKLAEVAAGRYPVSGFSSAGCPCCETFLGEDEHGRCVCGACPIKALTGKGGCHYTPFYNALACTASAARDGGPWDPCSERGEEAIAAVTEEVDFLRRVEARVKQLLEEANNEIA